MSDCKISSGSFTLSFPALPGGGFGVCLARGEKARFVSAAPCGLYVKKSTAYPDAYQAAYACVEEKDGAVVAKAEIATKAGGRFAYTDTFRAEKADAFLLSRRVEVLAETPESGWSGLVDKLVSSLKGFSRERVVLGLEALVYSLSFAPPSMTVDASLVEQVIAGIDCRLSEQMNAILHYRDFRSLESAWRGMHFLVSRLRFSENIVVQLLNASKQDLLDDFEDASEVVYSGLYRHIYVEQYGQYGGTPVGAMLGLYEVGVTPQDMRLLTRISAVAAMAHAPFLGSAGKSFFSVKSTTTAPSLQKV